MTEEVTSKSRPARIWLAINPSASVAMSIVFMLLFTLPRMAGFMIYPFVLGFIIWLAIKLIMLLFRKAKTMDIVKQAIWWPPAFLLVAVVHYNYASTARDKADAVVADIVQYRVSHGVYPAKLEELDAYNHMQNRPMAMMYGMDNSLPRFLYASTAMPFSFYNYDFDKHQWTFRAD